MRQALEHAPGRQTSSDALIDSLMSLSLDLPPQVPRASCSSCFDVEGRALMLVGCCCGCCLSNVGFLCHQAARWRKQQRGQTGPMAGAALTQHEVAQPKAAASDSDEEEQPRGLLRGLFMQHADEPPSIQSRTAGILSADRRESSLDDEAGL